MLDNLNTIFPSGRAACVADVPHLQALAKRPAPVRNMQSRREVVMSRRRRVAWPRQQGVGFRLRLGAATGRRTRQQGRLSQVCCRRLASGSVASAESAPTATRAKRHSESNSDRSIACRCLMCLSHRASLGGFVPPLARVAAVSAARLLLLWVCGGEETNGARGTAQDTATVLGLTVVESSDSRDSGWVLRCFWTRELKTVLV